MKLGKEKFWTSCAWQLPTTCTLFCNKIQWFVIVVFPCFLPQFLVHNDTKWYKISDVLKVHLYCYFEVNGGSLVLFWCLLFQPTVLLQVTITKIFGRRFVCNCILNLVWKRQCQRAIFFNKNYTTKGTCSFRYYIISDLLKWKIQNFEVASDEIMEVWTYGFTNTIVVPCKPNLFNKTLWKKIVHIIIIIK